MATAHRRLCARAVFCAVLLSLAEVTADARADDVKVQATSVGVRRFAPGAWGVRGVDVTNLQDSPAEAVVDVAFEGDPLMEYSRQAWVPPHSRRRVNVPCLPDVEGPAEVRARTWLAGAETGPVALPDESPVDATAAETLPRVQPPLTILISDIDSEADGISPTFEMVVALRLTAGNTRNLTEINATDVPTFPFGLEAADELVLVSDRVADSPSAIMTLSTWLQRGGRLWIPLEQVALRTVEKLLSDVVQITEVDRIRLADVQFVNRVKAAPSGPTRVLETPVDMLRVIPSDANIIHEVNGWPASFWLPVGSGQVLFTTVGPDAWMRPRQPNEQVAQLERNSYFVAETALDELATLMTRPLDPPPLSTADLAEYLSGDVGVRVPARATVFSVLGLFWAVWLGAGYWLVRRARLEWLAALGPLLALFAAAPLAVLGSQLRNAAPPTAALADFVEVGGGAATVHATGTATLFVPEPTPAVITADNGRFLMPQRDRLDGHRRRLLATDLDQWRWAELTLPTGLQTGATEQHISLTAPIRATATFGADGLTGQLELNGYHEPSDALVATQAPQALAVRLQPDGRFTAGHGERLERGAFLSGALLTDLQRRRNVVYQKLLTSKRELHYPQRPTLLVWTRTSATGLTAPDGMEESAAALVAAPLEIVPPPAGTDVFIPAPLLTYDVAVLADGTRSTLFDVRTGSWQKSSAAAEVDLRFRVPDAALPLAPQRAEFSVSIRAPSRTVTLATGLATSPVTLTSLESPAGRQTFAIDSADALRIDGDGVWHVRLQVGDLQLAGEDASAQAGIDRSWQVESLELELSGRTLRRGDAGETRE